MTESVENFQKKIKNEQKNGLEFSTLFFDGFLKGRGRSHLPVAVVNMKHDFADKS